MSIETIRKLFALANDQPGTPEGASAARVARRLVRERNIELSSLDEAERALADPFERREILLGGPRHWRCRLVSVVARHCECVAGYKPGSGKAWLYGRRSAVDVAEYLFVVLSRKLTLERANFVVELRGLSQEEQTRRSNDFSQSAVLALEIRLQELRGAEAQAHPEAAALVRAGNRGLGDWIRGRGRVLKVEPPIGHAFDEAGYRAGYRVPIVGAVE